MASLMGEATTERSAAEFAEELEKIGASVSVSPGMYETTVTVNTLTKNLDRALELMPQGARLLSRPAEVLNATAMWVKTCRILLGTALLGGPNFLTPENVRRISDRPDEKYRQRALRGPEKS